MRWYTRRVGARWGTEREFRRLVMRRRRFKDWVNREVEKKLDKEPFSGLPLRVRIGIVMLIGSFVIGYGLPMLLLATPWFHEHIGTGMLSGSFVYVLNWIVGAVGLVLAGRDCIKYPIYFFAKFVKMLFPRFFLDK